MTGGPDALTPIFSKCFEKLVREHICSVLPASLDPLQFAYRSNRSTDDAIAFTLHTALSHLENKNTHVRMLFVDYSLAFNTIVPATLVAKLQTLGLNRSLYSWILDFLTGRSQVVRMGNNTSSPLTLNDETAYRWRFITAWYGTVRYGTVHFWGVFHWVLYLVPDTFLVPLRSRFHASRTVTKT